jgi:hypothetical protein
LFLIALIEEYPILEAERVKNMNNLVPNETLALNHVEMRGEFY